MGFQITLLLATFFYVDYFQANMPTFSGWFLYHVIMHSTEKIGYFVDKLVVKSRKTTKSIWRVAFDLELLRGIYVYPTCHCHRNRNIKCSIQRLSDLVIQGFNYKTRPRMNLLHNDLKFNLTNGLDFHTWGQRLTIRWIETHWAYSWYLPLALAKNIEHLIFFNKFRYILYIWVVISTK